MKPDPVFQQSGGFSDGDFSGTFDVTAEQNTSSSITDDQALHKGVLTRHEYTEDRSSAGEFVFDVAVTGTDFSFTWHTDNGFP